MSHWTGIKTKIRNAEALKEACKALGHTLIENAQARGWGGATRKADFVLRLQEGYDIGFVKGADGYKMMADWMGVRSVDRDKFPGDLLDKVAEIETIRKLRAQGFKVGEPTRDENGRIVIRAVSYA